MKISYNNLEKYYPYIPAILIFMVGLVLSFFRWATQDEVVYLKDTMIISEFIKMGKWFGNESVGEHGFLLKIPVALFYLITGPSIWIATFFNVVLASLSAYLMHKVFNHFLKNDLYSMLAVILTVFSFYFVSVVPKYLRDIPVMFALLLFIYALIKEKPFWLLGLLFVLVLDAKEYIAVILTPVLLIWLPLVEYQKNKFSLKTIWNIGYKSVLLFAPAIFFLYLMFFTPIVPVNSFMSAFLKLTATESNVAKVNLDKQKLSFGTDTSRVISTIETEDEKINVDSLKTEQIKRQKYVQNLEPVKKSLALREALPKRKIKTTEIKKSNNVKTQVLANKNIATTKKTQIKEKLVSNKLPISKREITKKENKIDKEKAIVKSEQKIIDSLNTKKQQDSSNISLVNKEVKPDTTSKAKSNQSSHDSSKSIVIKEEVKSDTTTKVKSNRSLQDSSKLIVVKKEVKPDTTSKSKSKPTSQNNSKLAKLNKESMPEAKTKISQQKIKKANSSKVEISSQKIGGYKEGDDVDNLKEEKFARHKISSDSTASSRITIVDIIEEYSISILNIFIVYGQKMLSPRTFSYMSFPLYLIIISLIACIALLRKNFKRPDILFISIYLFMYLAVYLIRPSHARYLLHLVPIFSLFVIYFLLNNLDNYKRILIPVLITIPITAATLYYEITMPIVKLVAHIFFYSLLLLISYFAYKHNKLWAKRTSIAFVLLFSFFTFGSSIMASITGGQMILSQTFGQNNEYKEIAKYFDKNKTYWFNGDSRLIQFYNKDINQGLAPWQISGFNMLKEWVPKSQLETQLNYIPNFYFHNGLSRPDLMAQYNTDYIAFIYTTNQKAENINNKNLEFYEFLQSSPEWLELDKKIELKNKELYIYKIKYEE